MNNAIRLLPVIGALVMLAGVAMVPAAKANPPGVPPGEKLAFSFNYIAVPNGSASCGQGHRVFSPLSANGNLAG